MRRTSEEVDREIEDRLLWACRKVDTAYNLFGKETIDELYDDAIHDSTERIDNITTPECHHRKGTCDHAFPAWYIKEGMSAVREYLRAAKAYRKRFNR